MRCGTQAGPQVLLSALHPISPPRVWPPVPCHSPGAGSGRPSQIIELHHSAMLAGLRLLHLVTPHRVCLLLFLHLLHWHATTVRLGLERLVGMVFVIKLREPVDLPPPYFLCCGIPVVIREQDGKVGCGTCLFIENLKLWKYRFCGEYTPATPTPRPWGQRCHVYNWLVWPDQIGWRKAWLFCPGTGMTQHEAHNG
jgi:hypothetical protein